VIDSNDNQYVPPSTDSDDRHDHRPRNELLTRAARWTRNLAVVIVVWYSVAGALPPRSPSWIVIPVLLVAAWAIWYMWTPRH
jgi:hypothetical protein